jgi:hypothetical protein
MNLPSPSITNQDDRFQERNCSLEHEQPLGGSGGHSAGVAYYVYKLVDPRDSSCFYIGKGRGQRAWLHQKMVRYRSVVNAAKTNRILAILSAGKDVGVEIVAWFKDERMAYAHEFDLIQSTPGLTNIIGVGKSDEPPPSPEEVLAARRLAARQNREKMRRAQYERFIRYKPDYLKSVAREWIASLSAGEHQPEAPPEPERRHQQPLKTKLPPSNTSKRRKLRRKYRPSRRVVRPAITVVGLPPRL